MPKEGRHDDGRLWAVGVSLIEMRGEDHEQSIRLPSVLQRDAQLLGEGVPITQDGGHYP
jgi:hypothetical protein